MFRSLQDSRKRLTALPFVGYAVALLLIFSLPAAAQNNFLWSMDLFDPQTGTLTRVDEAGIVTTYPLPGLDWSQGMVAATGFGVSDDGRLIAYCVQGGWTVDVPTTLYVYDLISEQIVQQREMGTFMACVVGEHSFSPDGSALVVSLLPPYPESQDTTLAPPWSLLVLDVMTGETVGLLTQGDETAAAAGLTDDAMPFLPFVRDYDGSTVRFSLMPYATHVPDVADSYAWDIAAGSLAPVENLGYMIAANLDTTDEIAWATFNSERPSAGSDSFMTPFNEVRWTDGSEPQTVFASGAQMVIGLSYINDGQQLAIGLVDGVEMENPQNIPQTQWVALSRDGSIAPLTEPSPDFVDVYGAPGGHVVMTTAMIDNGLRVGVTVTLVRDGRETELWRVDEENLGQWWTVLRAGPVRAADDLTAFPPVE